MFGGPGSSRRRPSNSHQTGSSPRADPSGLGRSGSTLQGPEVRRPQHSSPVIPERASSGHQGQPSQAHLLGSPVESAESQSGAQSTPLRRRSVRSSAGHPVQDPSPSSQRSTRQRPRDPVRQACSNCQDTHLRCDAERPCGRCRTRDIAHTCADVPPKPRGRPKANKSVSEPLQLSKNARQKPSSDYKTSRTGQHDQPSTAPARRQHGKASDIASNFSHNLPALTSGTSRWTPTTPSLERPTPNPFSRPASHHSNDPQLSAYASSSHSEGYSTRPTPVGHTSPAMPSTYSFHASSSGLPPRSSPSQFPTTRAEYIPTASPSYFPPAPLSSLATRYDYQPYPYERAPNDSAQQFSRQPDPRMTSSNRLPAIDVPLQVAPNRHERPDRDPTMATPRTPGSSQLPYDPARSSGRIQPDAWRSSEPGQVGGTRRRRSSTEPSTQSESQQQAKPKREKRLKLSLNDVLH